jgi:hypothetical protein
LGSFQHTEMNAGGVIYHVRIQSANRSIEDNRAHGLNAREHTIDVVGPVRRYPVMVVDEGCEGGMDRDLNQRFLSSLMSIQRIHFIEVPGVPKMFPIA